MGAVVVVGSINRDVFFRVESLPVPGETVLASSTATGLGGKGANQAVAAARLGADVFFVGAIGDDEGPDERLNLRGLGVDVADVQQVAGAATGSAFVTVSASGENQIVVASGANSALDIDLLTDSLETRLRTTHLRADSDAPGGRSAVVVAQGELGGEVVERLVDAVRRVDAELETPTGIVLNLAPVVAVSVDAMRGVDVLVLNAGEATQLATGIGLDAVPAEGVDSSLDDSVVLCRRLSDSLELSLIITLGGEGAVLAEHLVPGVLFQPAVRTSDVVDSTGAGDCFVGALAARLAGGRPLSDALRWSVTAASRAVRSAGTIPSFPDRDAVESELHLAPAGVLRHAVGS